MNQQIDQVIAKDIKSAKVVIERKGQKAHIPAPEKSRKFERSLIWGFSTMLAVSSKWKGEEKVLE